MMPTSTPTPESELRTVRHDLRGRMNALLLCATALDQDLPLDEQIEFLNHVEQTIEKLLTLLDRLEQIS